jgi:coiled-coil and C2 domain-containing protein 2A
MARFVSLVPFMEDSGLHKRRGDIWCTNAECMHLTAGDSEEHAHLLAGFFLEIGQQVLVARGGCLKRDLACPEVAS